MQRKVSHAVLVAVALSAVISNPVCAQQKAEDVKALQKDVQNPLAHLINIQFPNDTNFPIGDFRRTLNVFNIQPVIPLRISENWNLITRSVLPVVSLPDITRPNGGTKGLSDLNPTLFLSPEYSGKVIWGIGPDFILPTATKEELGAGKWSVGPSVAVIVQPEKWTMGVLVSNVWSFAGKRNRSRVNSLSLEYLISRDFKKGWYFTSAPTITADWELSLTERWNVPVGPGIGRVFKIGGQSVSAAVSAYYNLIHPEHLPYPKWQISAELDLLFPGQN